MRTKFVVSALLVLALACVSSAQLSGNYTIDPLGSGPANFPTFAAAISTLNAGGVSGNVVFNVASTTFTEALAFTPITGVSSLATVTFQATGAPAIVDANAAAYGLTINSGTTYLNFSNLEVRNFTSRGLNLLGSSSIRGNNTFTNCKFEAPATTSSVYAAYVSNGYQNTFKNCQFLGGGRCLYHSSSNFNVFDGCEFDGKGMATYCVYLINSNDSDNLFQNCFFHDCSATGYGIYANASQYGVMFWHNTVIVTTSGSCVYAGNCCAWSRCNSYRDNIFVNLGTGTAMKYGCTATVLDYNDLDYNCYWAPNSTKGAVEAENTGIGFTSGTLAAWKTFFAANPGIVPAGGGTTWDQNSIEMDPMLVSMTAPYDIHLKAGSPCIDGGTTAYVVGAWVSFPASSIVATDFEGDARPATNVDIGADEVAVSIVGSGSGKIGTTLTFALKAPADGGLPYQVGSSFGSGPIPIDTRKVDLSPDSLLFLSIGGQAPTIFKDYAGVLDAQGGGTAYLNIPNIPGLQTIRVWTAFVTLKPAAPSGIQSISNSFLFTIQ